MQTSLVKPRWLRPRWRKVLTDLWGNKVRTFLVILSIAVGVFAVGFVSVTFIILLTDMDADYRSVNPHGAILSCTSFPDELLTALQDVDGVGQVEGRGALSGRIKTAPGKKATVNIIAIPDVKEMKIDRLRSDDGSQLILNDREVFIERSSLRALAVERGDVLKIELADGRTRNLRVAAVVHDITASPYIFTNRMSVYVNSNTMEWLGGGREFNQVYLTVSENKTDRKHVEAVAQAVAEKIKKSGREVNSTYIFQPGRHYASDFMTAIGFMLGFLGGLAVLLSAFLVVNTIIALLGQHVPHIGIMKLVGGSTPQIVGMYIGLVLCFGMMAFIIAAPVSAPLGYLTAKGISGFFNFNVRGFRVPTPAVLLQLGVAVFIPILTALYPVLNGTRITIVEAISSYGMGKGSLSNSLVDRTIERIRSLPRPVLISVRNAFRRKGRLALALSTLTLGGGIFIAVFNLWAVIDLMMAHTFGYFLSDVNVTLTRPYRVEQVVPLIKSVPGVQEVEGWGVSAAQLLAMDKKTATEILIVAPPAGSQLIRPVITSGRWLDKNDENGMVIGNHLIKERPDLKVGDEMTIKIEDREYVWEVVGIYEIAGMMAAPTVYANYEYLSRVKNETERVPNYRIMTRRHDAETEKEVIRILDTEFDKQGIPVSQIIGRTQLFGGMVASMDAIVYALLVMALLIALVGGLGLMGMMSMNVMERTREIGVMRSIGASDGTILQMVIVEGMFIGVISWLLGILLALPLTLVLSYVFGVALVNSPLAPAFSLSGYGVWLIIILMISCLASALPARSASRLTIREVLAYE